jgi:pantoate--beta-alanine ligase
MIRLPTIAEMQAQATAWRRAGHVIGLVPTMGYLHEGHLSLVRAARAAGAARVVVSIFVNPTQFGPTEDLAAAPRDVERDAELCAGAGVDALFLPSVAEMYPRDASTWVTEETLSRPLCGERRPGHFRGVTTIVAKLYLAALPDLAVFGQKDAQQALVLQRMTRDLNFPIRVIVAPIVREPDGLAMSSRNIYLTPDERRRATAIRRALLQAEADFAAGERAAATLCRRVHDAIAAAGGRVDYVECRATATLEPAAAITSEAVLAVAAYFGKARLLDNSVLRP